MMRRLAALLTVGAVAVVLAAAPSDAKALKLDLFRTAAGADCVGGNGTVSPSSFVKVKVGDPIVTAQVKLKGEEPNVTYEVTMAETPAGSGCYLLRGTLTTDKKGNGKATFTLEHTPGETGITVVLHGSSGDLTTGTVPYP